MVEKTKIIVLIDHSVHKFTELKKLVIPITEVRIFCCLVEEEVSEVLKNNSVDLVYMNPILPASFLKIRSSEITDVENGGVGHMLIRTIRKTTERANKKPLIIYNSHLPAEKLVEYGFQDVHGNYLPQPTSIFELIKLAEEKLKSKNKVLR